MSPTPYVNRREEGFGESQDHAPTTGSALEGFTPEQYDQLTRLGDWRSDAVAGPFSDGSIILSRDRRGKPPVRIQPGGSSVEVKWEPLQQRSQTSSTGIMHRPEMTVTQLIACAHENAAAMHPAGNLTDLLRALAESLEGYVIAETAAATDAARGPARPAKPFAGHTEGPQAAIVEPKNVWFIWTKRGRAPHFAHDTEASALAEAERLALAHPGTSFLVLHATHKFRTPHPSDEHNLTQASGAPDQSADAVGDASQVVGAGSREASQ